MRRAVFVNIGSSAIAMVAFAGKRYSGVARSSSAFDLLHARVRQSTGSRSNLHHAAKAIEIEDIEARVEALEASAATGQRR
jgi:hypothetical protein